MNSKMTSVADEIGRSICKYYEEEYLSFLFSGNIVIEDVIFQVLVECCRYAYLKNADKHSLKYYIDRDGMELELARKNLKRVIDYVNDHFELEEKGLERQVYLNLIGEIVEDKFYFGVSKMPLIFSTVYMVSQKELITMLEVGKEEVTIDEGSDKTRAVLLTIGKSVIFPDYDVKINIDTVAFERYDNNEKRIKRYAKEV